MSLVNLAHVCSHLQNASLARLGLTSIPLSKLHLSLSLHLQKQGFLSTVTLGGKTPPAKLLPPSLDEDLSAASGENLPAKPKSDTQQVTQANRASRRLWLGLKYWDGEPVLKKMNMVSKPTKRIWIGHADIERLIRGEDAAHVKGLTRIGECMFLTTDQGIMEARECAQRKIGGMVLCRAF